MISGRAKGETSCLRNSLMSFSTSAYLQPGNLRSSELVLKIVKGCKFFQDFVDPIAINIYCAQVFATSVPFATVVYDMSRWFQTNDPMVAASPNRLRD